MILVTFTDTSGVHRISDEVCQLTNQWKSRVISIDSLQLAVKDYAGGYVDLLVASITFSLELFEDNWVPDKSCTITVQVTETTEAAAITLFSGKAQRQSITQDSVVYRMYLAEYTNVIPSTIWIDGTLNEIFTTYSAVLGLTLNTVYSRNPSPDIYEQILEGESVIELLNKFAIITNHYFWISNGTLYLADMMADYGTDTLTYKKAFRFGYNDLPAYKRFESENVRKYSIASSQGCGEIEQSDVALSTERFYLRIGNNSGNDESWHINEARIPYETARTYMIKAKARRISGSGTLSIGFCGFSSDKATILDTANPTGHTVQAQHFAAANGASTGSDWVEYTGYASQWATYGESGPNPSISDPLLMQLDVAYIAPIVGVNISGQAGIFDIDFIAIYEVDSEGLILQELFYEEFTSGTFIYNWWNAAGTTNYEISTSIAESKANIESHLGNRKTLLESIRCSITLPLISDNIPTMGQKIQWLDKTTGPANSSGNILSTVCWIRVRNISFDLNQFEITLEGEGEIIPGNKVFFGTDEVLFGTDEVYF